MQRDRLDDGVHTRPNEYTDIIGSTDFNARPGDLADVLIPISSTDIIGSTVDLAYGILYRSPDAFC